VRSGDRIARAIRELRHLQGEIETFYRRTKLSDGLIGLRNAVEVALIIAQAHTTTGRVVGATSGRMQWRRARGCCEGFLQGASRAFYRYVLPGLILYGLLFEAARQPREMLGGSPGWDLAARLYIAAAFCAQSWIIGGTGIAHRWVSHYWQPWPEIRRDPAFILWHGFNAILAFALVGALTLLVIRGFLPTLAPYEIGIAIATAGLYVLPLLANRVLRPN